MKKLVVVILFYISYVVNGTKVTERRKKNRNLISEAEKERAKTEKEKMKNLSLLSYLCVSLLSLQFEYIPQYQFMTEEKNTYRTSWQLVGTESVTRLSLPLSGNFHSC